MTVATPVSVTDPYAPEPSNTAPVRLRLRYADGRTVERVDTVRVLTPPTTSARGAALPIPLRLRGVLFLFRGIDPDGARLYREVPALDLDDTPEVDDRRPTTLDALQAEFVALEAIVAGNVPTAGHGSTVTSVDHGTACVRRQAIAFHLVRAEIARIQKLQQPTAEPKGT